MKMSQFYSYVAKVEGKKKQTPIAQIREILKIVNKKLSKTTKIKNFIYKAIKKS